MPSTSMRIFFHGLCLPNVLQFITAASALQHSRARLALGYALPYHLLQRSWVIVREALDVGAAGARADDDGGVVECIADDEAAL